MLLTEILCGILLYEHFKNCDRMAQEADDIGCSPKMAYLMEKRAYDARVAFDNHAKSLDWEWSF